MGAVQALGSARPEHHGAPPRFVLATLCLTQIPSWGVLFYAFPVASPQIVAQTGWSSTMVSGAFSLGLLSAAGAGIGVGRLLDRRGPHLVMTAGSVIGTAAVFLVAAAPDPRTFIVGWLLAGLAQAAVLYPPAFAALTRWYGAARVRALTTLTLVAGLASTVHAETLGAVGRSPAGRRCCTCLRQRAAQPHPRGWSRQLLLRGATVVLGSTCRVPRRRACDQARSDRTAQDCVTVWT
ncbi:MFS transporter [Ornithinicoccus halotolerans]|uniref:MFS transporter n=1 Tax=Ornithinicoccus halotolerans TaxID=1748220 RepID=UPI00129791D6|nr:MFS transporter [Ornithinicoccus halotolerans]